MEDPYGSTPMAQTPMAQTPMALWRKAYGLNPYGNTPMVIKLSKLRASKVVLSQKGGLPVYILTAKNGTVTEQGVRVQTANFKYLVGAYSFEAGGSSVAAYQSGYNAINEE